MPILKLKLLRNQLVPGAWGRSEKSKQQRQEEEKGEDQNICRKEKPEWQLCVKISSKMQCLGDENEK